MNHMQRMCRCAIILRNCTGEIDARGGGGGGGGAAIAGYTVKITRTLPLNLSELVEAHQWDCVETWRPV